MKYLISHNFENLTGNADLEERLRNWSSFSDVQMYDYDAMIHLFGACLDNLRKYALEGELDDIGDYLYPEQLSFLIKLAEIASASLNKTGF